MKLFFWKHNQLVDSFAKTLADELFSQVPPNAVRRYFSGNEVAGEKLSPQKDQAQRKEVERLIKDAVIKVQQFKAQQSLGVYRKARLHLVFTERLTELGFALDIAQQVNQVILLQSP